MSDYLLFMKALTDHRIIRQETLQQMISDDVYMGFPMVGFDYGYSIWKPRTIPVILPPEMRCWGCVGVTGAFTFYHPGTELNFMVRKVIRELIR